MQKRCFNTVEAQQYLGVKRRFFEAKLAPLLAGKESRPAHRLSMNGPISTRPGTAIN